MGSRRVIPSPRETLIPFLSESQAAALPYPPNLLPGARDVKTPYGVMRVYEWGPDVGRKVLLVHGDTTPAPILGPIAAALVQLGCRVMVIVGVPYDTRLFSMQILVATASSTLSWTGAASGGFSIIGYSLGGAITMSFASHFSYLVKSIVLMAPGGLLRHMPDGYDNIFFRYSWLAPFSYLRKLVGNTLGLYYIGTASKLTRIGEHSSTAIDAPQELQRTVFESPNIAATVQWQFDNHQGFVHSFVNTVKHGPIMHQQSEWSNICEVIKGITSARPTATLASKISNSKILVLLGDADRIIAANELHDDLGQILGPEHVEFRTVSGDHEFPGPSSAEVIKHISDFWELNLVS